MQRKGVFSAATAATAATSATAVATALLLLLLPLSTFAQTAAGMHSPAENIPADGALTATQPAEDNTFGGWFFAQVSHTIPCGIYLTGYLEHDNFQFQRLDCNYARLSAGASVLPWLKVGVNYVPVNEPGGQWSHFGELDLMGTLRSGGFKVSIRERYRHGFTTGSNELRSRLKVAYSVPGSGFGFYLAPEVFTWGNEWMKTRHYVACTYDFTEHIQLECYYLYYAFRSAPAQNVLGLGVNFEL